MDARSLAGASILVTGGTGFIGSAFVRHAIASGARVAVVARAEADHWRLRSVAGRYRTIAASLAELDAIAPELDTDVLVHFAGAGVNQAFDDVGQIVETNVNGTLHVLKFALRSGVRRFIQLGSSSEYGSGVAIDENCALNPTTEYGASRAAATLLALAFGRRRGLDVVVIRPFAVYGPFEAAYRLVPYCILRSLRSEAIDLSSGIQTRDYVYVADVAKAIARAAIVPGIEGEIFNVCSGTETTVLEAATSITQLVGSSATVIAGARTALDGEMWRTSGNPAHVREVLGWTVQEDFENGVERTIRWFRDEGVLLEHYRQS